MFNATRFWTDKHDDMWCLCDLCDRAIMFEDSYRARVADWDDREKERDQYLSNGAEYCRDCARKIAGEWATQTERDPIVETSDVQS